MTKNQKSLVKNTQNLKKPVIKLFLTLFTYLPVVNFLFFISALHLPWTKFTQNNGEKL